MGTDREQRKDKFYMSKPASDGPERIRTSTMGKLQEERKHQ